MIPSLKESPSPKDDAQAVADIVATAQEPTVYIIEPPGYFSLNFKELREYRELFYFFTWRDIKVKYKQTVLGFLWAILQPFLMMLLFTAIFGNALGVESDGIPYPIFAYSGLLLWNVFASGLNASANSMVTNANLIKKIYFPRMIIPMSSVLVALFDFLMAVVVYIGILIYYQYEVDIPKILLFLPLSLILTVISTFGLGSILASLNVKYRDFRYVVPYLIQFLLFINPVIYSTSIFTAPWAKYVIAINPMAGAINMSRFAFVDKPIEWDLVGISVASGIILMLLGVYVFRKTEAYFADLA